MSSPPRPAVAWALCGLSLTLLAVGTVLQVLLPGPATSEDEDWVSFAVSVSGFIGFPLVGAVLAARVPANRYGWLWSALGVVVGLAFLTQPLLLLLAVPGWVLALAATEIFLVFVGFLVPVFLLFPTGGVPGTGWRWVARGPLVLCPVLGLIAPFSPWDVAEMGPRTPWAQGGTVGRLFATVFTWGYIALLLLCVAAIGSLFVRFRRAGPIERRQLAWFLYAAMLNGALIVLELVDAFPAGLAGTVLDAVMFGLLQLAVVVAVLKYHLYEIDRILSRTVTYAVLTVALGAAYVVGVAVLRRLLAPVTGSTDPAVAASTLAVAAAFQPARRRVQAVVDRRFDRARYDAARTVDAYAARLRTQVDLDAVTAGLRDTVVSTVGPVRVGLWLSARRPGPAAHAETAG